MPLYHSVVVSLAKHSKTEFAETLRKCCHGIFHGGAFGVGPTLVSSSPRSTHRQSVLEVNTAPVVQAGGYVL